MTTNKTITPSHPIQHGAATVAPVSAALAHATNAGETAALAMATKQKALVEARFTLAQHRPRDMDVVRAKLLKLCARPAFARTALYHKPVGEGLEGLSIRFVEEAMSVMGNCYSDVVTIHDDAEKRILHVEVTDAETNVGHSSEVAMNKTVERNSVREGDEVIRTRTNKNGRTVYIRRATDDEILNTSNNLTSKAIRTSGLRLVPAWLKDECMEAIRATLQGEDAQDPEAARNRVFDAFALLGVTPDQIKSWLGHEAAILSPAERTTLLGIHNAIRDGETTWAEVMDARIGQRAKEGKAPAALPPAQATGTPPAKGLAGVKARVAAARQAQKQAAPPPDDVPGWGAAPEPTPPEGEEREPGEEG